MDPGAKSPSMPLFLLSSTITFRFDTDQIKKIHNQAETRAMMSQLYDPQMAKVADFNCFSQVIFRRLEDYKRFKQDPVYKQRLTGDHENFADTKKSM